MAIPGLALGWLFGDDDNATIVIEVDHGDEHLAQEVAHHIENALRDVGVSMVMDSFRTRYTLQGVAMIWNGTISDHELSRQVLTAHRKALAK